MKRVLLLIPWLASAGGLVASQSPLLVFSGMCDASAAVALDDDLFAVGKDEDNLILSDDGALMSDGRECKSLPENQRRFRAFPLAR